MIRKYLPKNTEELIRWYERYVSPLSLIGGFLADNYILLRRVDLWQTNVLFFTYLAIAAAGIVFINLVEAGRVRHKWLLAAAPFIPVVVQFSFGGLFSGFLSLYSRSASFAVSWVFVLALAALLLGNERFRKLYVRFSFQISLYFTVLFSFFAFFVPVLFRAIGPVIFLTSGFLSLGVIALFLYLLRIVVPEIVKRDLTRVARTIAVIFVVFNALYFTNAIPPLPLSLKAAGVYHGVTKTGDAYRLLAEPVPWYKAYLSYNTLYHRTAGESAYAYSAIFAPSGLSTIILHQWQRYDIATKRWVTTDTLRFTISGGRDGGYRGYSIKSGLSPGDWRVNVLTQYGQIIGRIAFTVVDAPEAVPLEQITR